MSSHRAVPLLLICLFLGSAFGETASWQQGTVLSVEQRSFQPSPDYRCTTSPNGTQSSTSCRPVNQTVPFWEVTLNLENRVLVVRPYVMPSGAGGAVVALLKGAAHQSLKDYVLPQGISAGMSVKVAVFSNGTVTLQNGSGRNYTAEIVSQALTHEQPPAQPTNVSPQNNSDPIGVKPESEQAILPEAGVVYLVNGSDLIKLEVSQAKALPQTKPDETIYVIPGSESRTETALGRPVFLVQDSSGIGWPEDLELYRMEVKDGSRAIRLVAGQAQAGLRIPLSITRTPDAVFHLAPKFDLAPGEYTLSPKSSNRSFQFRVIPAARETGPQGGNSAAATVVLSQNNSNPTALRKDRTESERPTLLRGQEQDVNQLARVSQLEATTGILQAQIRQQQEQIRQLQQARTEARAVPSLPPAVTVPLPTPPTAAYTAAGSGHWIGTVSSNGRFITLEDGSLWDINSIDQIDTALWLPITDIVVRVASSPSGDFKYLLINTEDGGQALAKYLGSK